MDRAVATVTEDDLLRALQRARADTSEENPEGALTTKEIVQKTGWDRRRVYDTLDLLGHLVECVDVKRKNRAGHPCTKPAYRLRQQPADREHGVGTGEAAAGMGERDPGSPNEGSQTGGAL